MKSKPIYLALAAALVVVCFAVTVQAALIIGPGSTLNLVGGNLSLNGGVIIVGGGTFNVGGGSVNNVGNINVTGGSFNPGGAIIIFNTSTTTMPVPTTTIPVPRFGATTSVGASTTSVRSSVATTAPTTTTVLAAGVNVGAPTVNFGSVRAGTSSAAQSLTLIFGGGSLDWLTLGGIAATGYFSQSNNCPGTLYVGDSCVIQVTFSPPGLGVYGGTLTITSDDPSSPNVINLTGKGVSPRAEWYPKALYFGTQPVNTESGALEVTLRNQGSGPLAVGRIGVAGEFDQANTCGSSLASGGSCTIGVAFKPRELGTRDGSLTIVTDDAGSPHTVPLQGEGVAPATTTTTTVPGGGVPTSVPTTTTTITGVGSPLVGGGCVSGSIERYGETDWYTLLAAADGVYTLWTDLGTLEDSVLYLFGPDSQGVLVAQNDDCGLNCGGRDRLSSYISEPLNAGTYYVKARAYRFNQTGGYEVCLLEPGADGKTTTSVSGIPVIEPGGSASGDISTGGEEDWYQFHAPNPGVYTMWTELGTLRDSVMSLYGPNDQVTHIATDDDGGVGFASRISATLLQAGAYFIKVHAYRPTQKGSYTVRLSGSSTPIGGSAEEPSADGPPTSIPALTPVEPGESAPGSIETGGGEDWFRFTAAAAGVYRIWTELGTLEDTVLYVYGPGGQQRLVDWNDDAPGKRSSSLELNLVPGEYYVKVKAYRATQTGSYTLNLGLR